jgi:choline kinase
MIPTALLVAAGVGYFLGREIEAWLVTIANRRLQRDMDRT